MSNMEAMNLRRSVRTYKGQAISRAHMDAVKWFVNELTPLNDIPFDIIFFENGEVISKTFKGIANMYSKVIAPHYIAITSKEEPGYLENVGFVGEQLILKLTALGIGSCWLGRSIDRNVFNKIAPIKTNQSYIILISFGYAEEDLSPISKRNRLTIKQFVEGEINKDFIPILNALRIAPSAVNSQPWRIVVEENTLHVYMKTKNFISEKILSKLNLIDMGIGLCHMFKAAEELGLSACLKKHELLPIRDLKYIVSMEISD
ncbi:nitroreductase family protein [Clostridium sp. KNHs214]|uniref:nitroreductase family protein n=1 Tax=Clostridium sp. KNHs214 TaxID=1540257 RepID=UPI000557A9DA|nr:nitroreductase family protein [Clostridium sp. KNHs214]